MILSPEEIGDIELITSEMVANGIKHGNKNDPNKKVVIELSIERKKGEPDEAIVTVIDEGTGFDPDKVPDPTSGEGLTKSSGRGILLARQLMDSVEFPPGEPKVIFRKKKTVKADGNEKA